ncbi:AAA family ATPase [Natrinema salsiterrestre]|uniref:AAA family ATPase n=1 Tax=Natrinema salsiterrestre TaxID=2950540 RepID=A0A9Q4Q1P0_9EURY|nr:AAA family ATPase [Natrinema salsiterrestre]MDF9747479.1 AAA family ATPase [Natrinema salsiterrestre]
MENLIHLVGGAPGVGKSTIVEEVNNRPDIDIFYARMGNLIYELARDEGHVENTRDRIRPALYRELGCTVAENLRSDIDRKHIVLDCHFVDYDGYGYMPKITVPVANELAPDTITVIEAPPEVVPDRIRDRIRSKERAVPSIEGVQEHMMLERQYAVSISNQVGCWLRLLNNENSTVESTAESFARSIVSYSRIFEY